MSALSMRRGFLLSLLALLIIVPSLTFGQIGLNKAIQAKERHTVALFQINGVIATGVSEDANGRAVIKVFTDRAVANLPNALNGVRVVIEPTDPFVSFDRLRKNQSNDQAVAQMGPGNGNGNGGGNGGGGNGGGGNVSPQDRFDRPVPIGVSLGSTGPTFCFAGTLGCRLKATNSNGEVTHFILSNNHVLANENDGIIGVDQPLQPGTLDNNCFLDFNDTIGVLSDFETLNFNGQPNQVDAAIALTDVFETGVSTPSGEAYGTPTSNTVAATVGTRVVKYGRTTAFTYGKVDSVNVTVNVGYDNGTALFANQIVFRGTLPNGNGNRSFSAGGDSGALIVELDTNNPMGLLFAGNNSFTIGNPIQTVLDTFSTSGVTFKIDDGNE